MVETKKFKKILLCVILLLLFLLIVVSALSDAKCYHTSDNCNTTYSYCDAKQCYSCNTYTVCQIFDKKIYTDLK